MAIESAENDFINSINRGFVNPREFLALPQFFQESFLKSP